MIYHSTRDAGKLVTFSEAVKLGISPDGGLFVPERFPKITQFDEMINMSYNEKAKFILKYFLTDFTEEEIEQCINLAYNKENFETNNITPIYELNEKTYVLELWHGPTSAFKDLALQIMPHLLINSIRKTNEDKEVVILVATSGDTGKAALEGFKDVEGVKIIVFYPNNGVSEIQERQMITQEGQNTYVVGINGNFDNAQSGVKEIFTDESFIEELDKKNYILSSANSINLGRLIPQIVYYFAGYINLLKNNIIKQDEKINIVVPTGNFGNILAAFYAKEMNLPINKLICASNKNNVITEFVNSGIYNKNREFYKTISPSMDILISSNLERFLYALSDDYTVRGLMKELNENGQYKVSEDIKNKINEILYADFSDDIETYSTIQEVFKQYDYVVDTHTAVAKNVYDKYLGKTKDNSKTIIVSTASPFKFSKSILYSLFGGGLIKDKKETELLDVLFEKTGVRIPKGLESIKDKEVKHTLKCERNEMKDIVKNILKI